MPRIAHLNSDKMTFITRGGEGRFGRAWVCESFRDFQEREEAVQQLRAGSEAREAEMQVA